MARARAVIGVTRPRAGRLRGQEAKRPNPTQALAQRIAQIDADP
jgi:hypothetical protein